MRNLRLTIQYDGTDYSGWQVQPPAKPEGTNNRQVLTVQGILQETIKKITGEEVNVLSAGRTDAGVHALGQVASFRTGSGLSAEVLLTALNANLPEAIRLLDASEAAPDFHPRYDARGKVYFYLISNDRIVSPFLHRYLWRLPYRLDFDGMNRALEALLGTHDFSAFRASGCGARTTVRTVSGIAVEKLTGIDFMTAGLAGNFMKISIEADAFLRHMVRNIVGTIVEVGRGKIRTEDVAEVLRSKDRKLAGPTAPAQGLFLDRVFY